MSDVLKKIESKNIKRSILLVFIELLLIVTLLFVVKVAIGDNQAKIQLVFLLTCLIILIIVVSTKLFKSIRLAIKPEVADVFKKYGSIDKVNNILKDILRDKIYEDNNLIISDSYICSKKNVTGIISCDNVLGAHIVVHKRNSVVLYYQLVIIDKYNQAIIARYEKNNEELLDKILVLIKKLCPNAKIGYTKEEKENIRKKSIKL